MPEEIRGFLRELDARLDRPVRLVVIEGAAVALGWDEHHATPDVDLFNNPGEEFWRALASCTSLPGAIPVSKVGVVSPPYHFEDRLVRLELVGLEHLAVFIPEAHDLAMMKLVRGETHDLDAIEDIHRVSPLSLETLTARFHETRAKLIGPEFRFIVAFLALVARLYGEHVADDLEAGLRGTP